MASYYTTGDTSGNSAAALVVLFPWWDCSWLRVFGPCTNFQVRLLACNTAPPAV